MNVGDRVGLWSGVAAFGRRGIGVLALVISVVACGDGSGGEERPVATTAGADSTVAGTLALCVDDHHFVVFSVFGVATGGGEDAWFSDGAAEPVPRPGAPEVLLAYQERGYGVLYITLLPESMDVGGEPLVAAVTGWLQRNGFPVGASTRVWAWDGEGTASVALIDELSRLRNGGVEIGASYVSTEEEVFPLKTGGVSSERLYALGDANAADDATSLPDDDLEAHLPSVEALEPVCERI